MKRLINIYVLVLVFFALCISYAVSNADSEAQGTAVEDLEREAVGISVERVDSNEGIVKCRYCGRLIKNGSVHRDAVSIIQKQVEQGLYARRIKFSGGTERLRYINVYVFRFEERKGGNYSAEKPATVGFHMHLFENNVLKRIYVFDEEQQALTQNLFGIGKFFKRGGKWITAEKLSEEGIDKGLNALVEDLSQADETPVSPTEDVPR